MARTDTNPPYVDRLRVLYLPVLRAYLLIAGGACWLTALIHAGTGSRSSTGWMALAELVAGMVGLFGAFQLRAASTSLHKQTVVVTAFNLAVTAAVFVRLGCGEATMASIDFAILALAFALAGPTPAAVILSTGAALAGVAAAMLATPAALRGSFALSEAPVSVAAIAGALLRQKVVRSLASDHERMAQLNLSLEEERASNLAVAAQSRRASEAKSEFLTRMSHDLRTPLNGVTATIELLSQSRLTRRQRELCDLAAASTRTVVALVSDLFDASQLEAGLLDLKTAPFDLSACLTEIANAARPAIIGKGLTYEVELSVAPGIIVEADHVRLRQVVGNLLSNAVKFTSDGRISLTASTEPCADPDRLSVQIIVSDTGIGLEPTDCKRLFLPFEQNHDPRPPGSGLGLAIVKSIVERMGGDVTVDGAPGLGAAFTFRLEFARAHQDSAIKASTEGDDRLRILAADDHPTNRKVIELMLLPTASSLTLVEDGRAAVDAWLSAEFDVVLMDMQMPVMDGLEAIRLIRTLEREMRRPRTPIAMLTAATMPENIAAALAAGADLHLSKPITPSVLDAGLRRTINLARAVEEANVHSNLNHAASVNT